MTGTSHHLPARADAASAEPTPAEAASTAASRKVTVTEVQQPLRVYWEYLSYLFQKVPALSAEEDLEKGYRDFLQVSTSKP